MEVSQDYRRSPIRDRRMSADRGEGYSIDLFQSIPDDLCVFIFTKLSSSASSPLDLPNAMLVCRRFRDAASHPSVLAGASANALYVEPSRWSKKAYCYLILCVDCGNMEAAFMLGMISFYCLKDTAAGMSLLTKAADASHLEALHSLAVIKFNGSGASKTDKDPKGGFALCTRAAKLGYIDSIRELGHCLQDGHGVPANPKQGRRFLLEANAREALAAGLIAPVKSPSNRAEGVRTVDFVVTRKRKLVPTAGGMDSVVDFPVPELHIVHKFLLEWFEMKPLEDGFRMCSFERCGRPETRRHEFRRCSVCGTVNYCSRCCQALHWRTRHRFDCPRQHQAPQNHAEQEAVAFAPEEGH
eukprot:TRINITY_DN2825_c0_g2_i2.p1 TRINITY_DN2825_c0_g2~~TRINITY_DN2825_c0_g2_i2.p1  ORF type:complete len:356 (+),score=20.25 TRINITY_DN2825_c0_g2_i2:76-1143(+)